MADILLAAHAAVVGTMQGADNPVQLDLHARTVAGFDNGADVVQERLDIAPVNIAAQGVLEDVPEQAVVAVSHWIRPWSV
jgi:hypothetical protein